MSTKEHPATRDGSPRLAAEVHHRVEHMLHARNAPTGTRAATWERDLKRRGERVWSAMKKRPSIGVIAAGAIGLGLASTVGVGELIIALTAGYAAYQVLREGATAADAMKKSITLLEDMRP